ncbi:hypothetical protein F9C07_2286161 [Aspergillus flavus]|uniref:Uncharacterized protein n=2 Tax=Aspergillus flavus TaxID=5059 RepID=A0A7U2R348_ASPFN|nr:uncharacterized protein G4B84_009720 [Aspergillus flavus NRRL3357]QRD93989.1 hypothetical protein F9C07_2286161 [Aspergillus flavus]KAF7622419.1 hypothetical protein AFLA_008956 [Aspergillus flavus NRRL3357]QMW34254.1 hypothetical protein G4B84_009720 [Aspergillus flavus NRRL3357]RMZ45207.1 hypothetical protein CA14_006979 [Aspergillus flavus]UDD63161.1 hypothetical protein AFCA_010437 [Aspergillus flavus]
MAFTTEQEKAAAAVVVAAQAPSTVKDYVDDIKIKAWTQNDWTGILGAAPVCLELLGCCSLAASTDVGRSTKLTAPAKGFKFLRGHQYLSTNLVEVANEGSRSFHLARTKMADIGVKSEAMKSHVLTLLKALREERFSGTVVKIELNVLKDTATQCVANAKAMDDQFQYWLNYIMELHEACQDEESRGAELFQRILSDEKAKKTYEEMQQKSLKEHEGRVKKAEEALKEEREKYKNLMDNFPTGNDLLVQQLAIMGAETAASLIKIAGTAAAVYFSPGSALAFTSEAVNDTKKTSDQDKRDGSGSGKSGKGTGNDKAGKEGKEDKKDKAGTDAALSRCPPVLQSLEVLNDILNDKVDWDRILSGSNADKKLTVVVAETFLTKVQESINNNEEEKKSSGGKALLKVITDSLKVINEMNEERKKSNDAKEWKKPADDSKIVKGWRTAVDKSLNGTKKMQSKAKASRTQTAGNPNYNITVPDNSADQIQARKDLTQATVDAATARLEMAMNAYLEQQKMAQEMHTQTLKLQEELAKVHSELAQLGQKKLTLEDVRRVLRDCISYLIQLKDNVRKLTIFFSTLSMLVGSAVEKQVIPFIQLTKEVGDDRTQGNLVNQFTVNTILQYALNVAANFSLYQDIANMYIEVNDNHILKGLTLVDEMTKLTDKQGLEVKQVELRNYSKGAKEGIAEILAKTKDKICAGSSQRYQELQDLLKNPALPPRRLEHTKAIEEGAAEGSEEVAEDIKKNNAALEHLAKPTEERDADQGQLADAIDPGDDY